MERRVLIVDDDRDNRATARAALEAEGYRVAEAGTCERALELLAGDEPFAVIAIEREISGEHPGTVLLEQARAMAPASELIAMGRATLDEARDSLRGGASTYLRKPLSGAEFAHAVKRTLLARALADENALMRGLVHTYEAARPLTTCVETADVLPLSLDLLGHLLGRGRAVGRLMDLSERPGDGIYLRGFPEDQARALRPGIEAGKLFDPASLEFGTGANAGLQEALTRLCLDDENLLALPLHHGDRIVGGIWVYSEGDPFTEDETRRAELICQHAELALDNAERFVQASEKAFIDDVTDLYNARYLLSALDREVTRAERAERALAVLFLDLDRFKLVNDQHGHLVGSSALRELGAVLQEEVRAVDTVARYGGDEFTILLVDTDLAGARQVADRIRRTVAGTAFGQARGLRLALTVSVGVAVFPRHGPSRERLLDQADKAMYLAKALGRDQVCSADELTQPPQLRPER